MLCINVPVTTTLTANYGNYHMYHAKCVCFVTGRWNTNGLGKERVTLLCNLKIQKIPAYTSWA